MAFDWKPIDPDMVFSPESRKRWLEWLEEKRNAEIAAQAEHRKIMVEWSSPSGLIPYAKHE